MAENFGAGSRYDIPLTDIAYWVEDGQLYSASLSDYNDSWMIVNAVNLEADVTNLLKLEALPSLECSLESVKVPVIFRKDGSGITLTFNGEAKVVGHEVFDYIETALKGYFIFHFQGDYNALMDKVVELTRDLGSTITKPELSSEDKKVIQEILGDMPRLKKLCRGDRKA